MTESAYIRSDALAGALSGDETAFAQIVAAHHGDMRRVCAVVCGEGLADDAVQAAWPIAWRQLHSVRRPDRLRAWLVSIAVNQAKQILRKQRRRQERITLVREAPEHAGGLDPAMGIDLLDLRVALDRLDPDDRALLAMRYVVGFNATELSSALGISPSGTRNRLERLLKRLREELGHG